MTLSICKQNIQYFPGKDIRDIKLYVSPCNCHEYYNSMGVPEVSTYDWGLNDAAER